MPVIVPIKNIKKAIVVLLCISMVMTNILPSFADENAESSEPQTTYVEDTESTNDNDTIDNIEEPESNEEEADDEISDEGSEENEEVESNQEEADGEVLDEVSEEIDEPQEDAEELGEEPMEPIVEEPEEDLDEVDIASSSEIIDEEVDDIVEKLEEELKEELEEEPEEEKQEEEKPTDKILNEKIENATASEVVENVDEEIIDDATPSEIEEIIDDKCEVTIYFLTDMKLKDKGNGGSYNYSWDTFIVDKNKEFYIDEKIPEVIKHSSCEQEYTLVGFTTENQIDSIWKGADYAGGVSTIDKSFIVNNDIEIFAVYEAKDTYISSITIDNEITYKTTTIPNKAIKNIYVSDNKNNIYIKNENVKYYKIKNNLDDTNYMFTKDSSEGKPIKVEDFSLKKYKK